MRTAPIPKKERPSSCNPHVPLGAPSTPIHTPPIIFLGLDIWRVSPVAGGGNASDGRPIHHEVEVLAPPVGVTQGGLSAVLAARARTVVGDVAAQVDAEAARVRAKGAATAGWTAKRDDDTFFETYRPYGDHRRFMLELAEEVREMRVWVRGVARVVVVVVVVSGEW